MKYYFSGYGFAEFKEWKDLRLLEVRYISSEYCYDLESDLDLYETLETGELVCTKIEF